MVTTYSITPVSLRHVTELAQGMREADRQEVWAAGHQTPEQAVHLSLAASRQAWVGLADERVVFIVGVGSGTILCLTGVPWLLATNKMEQHARRFLRESREMVAVMREDYALLRNYVDVRNRVAIRWLRWLGFEILPPEPFGIDSLPFHPFEMRALDHV